MASDLLQQVRLLDPVSQTDQVTDVLIENGVIRQVGGTIAADSTDTTVHNCEGMVLGPGLVDLYSHSGEPGFEERETLESLLAAATAGGYTRVAILPDTVPALDNPASVRWVQERVEGICRGVDRRGAEVPRGEGICGVGGIGRLLCWAALTQDGKGQQMTELAELATTGGVGFADGQSLTNWQLLRRVLEYLRPLNQPVALWACDSALTGNGVMREGLVSIQLGLPGTPAMAETVALAALLECVEIIGTPVHLMRLSTSRGVELIRQAKARGVPVTASTTWMHLLLNTESVDSYDSSLHIAPPLGNPQDQEALRQGLREGVLDAVAVDHTPFTYEEKTVAFAEAPPGAIGLELALPLLWHHLVERGDWSPLELWQRLSTKPLECLHLQPESIQPDQPAELTLFDPRQEWKVDERSLKSLSSNTPWLGKEIQGRVVRIWC